MKKIFIFLFLMLIWAIPSYAQSTAEQIQLGFLSTDIAVCGGRPKPCWTPYSVTYPLPTTGGGGSVTWPASGDIVISNGTSSPAGLAEVDGQCAIGAGGVWVAGSCSGSSSVNLGTSASATSPHRAGDATTGLYSDTANTIEFSEGGVNGLSLNSSAVVSNLPLGVGAFPDVPFRVHPATNDNLRVVDHVDLSSGIYIQSANDGPTAFMPLQIEASTILINKNMVGNVGIGTSTPGSLLAVNGTITAKTMSQRPPFTVSVCSSTARATTTCDFNATGTNDEVPIQAAVDFIVASSFGGFPIDPGASQGTVVLSEGNFSICNPVIIRHGGLTFQGNGATATWLHKANGCNSDMFDVNATADPSAGLIFRDIMGDGNNSVNTTGHFLDTKVGTIAMWDTQFFGVVLFFWPQNALEIRDPWGFEFLDSQVEESAGGIDITVGAVKTTGAKIIGSKLLRNTAANITITGVDGTIIVDNELGSLNSGTYAVQVTGGTGTKIASNLFWGSASAPVMGGIGLTTTAGTIINGNSFGGLTQNAIDIDSGSSKASIVGNMFSNITGIEINNLSNTTQLVGNQGDDAVTQNADLLVNVGIGSSIPRSVLDMSQNTGAIILPIGTTGQEPSPAINGMMRYNSSTPTVEAYVNNVWVAIGGGSGSGVTTTGSPANTYLTSFSGASTITGTANATLSSGVMTLATSQTVPLVVGGSAGNDTLTIQSTSNVTTHASDAIIFQTGAQATAMRIQSNGNVVIGSTTPSSAFEVDTNGALSSGNGPAIAVRGTWITGGTTTTNKPQVVIEPSGTTSTNWTAGTNGTGFGINAPSGFNGNLFEAEVSASSKFTISQAGNVTAAGNFTSTNGIFTGGNFFAQSGAGATIRGALNANTTGSEFTVNSVSAHTANAGNMALMTLSGVANFFAPTTGTGTVEALNITMGVNQTSTATGVTDGILINPVLTSTSDFRALEVPALTNNLLGNPVNATQHMVYFNKPTYTATTATQTITTASTVDIVGAPVASTNVTITNGYALNVEAGNSNFGGHVQLGGGTPVVSTCGSGSLASGSSDQKGQITGITAATACTLTFATALPTAPACTFASSTGIAVGGATTTSAFTTTMALFTGTLYYICF